MSLERLSQEVSSWNRVTVHPHRFGGEEFRVGSAEIGHVHVGGIVDIPFPRTIRDVLLDEGFAEEHRWVPNSGWITFRMRRPDDWKHALWLLRISYLRYLLKSAPDPAILLDQECERLRLTPRLHSLLEPFAGRSINPKTTQTHL